MKTLPLWIALAVTLVAAGTDLRDRRIPNRLTLGTVVLALLLRTALEDLPGLGLATAGLLTAFLPALALFALRALGGGDVKLLAGCGALLGPAVTVELLLATAVAGGALAAVLIAARHAWTLTGWNFLRLALHWRSRGFTACPEVSLGASAGVAVPYAVAIACGMLVTVAPRLAGV